MQLSSKTQQGTDHHADMVFAVVSGVVGKYTAPLFAGQIYRRRDLLWLNR